MGVFRALSSLFPKHRLQSAGSTFGSCESDRTEADGSKDESKNVDLHSWSDEKLYSIIPVTKSFSSMVLDCPVLQGAGCSNRELNWQVVTARITTEH
jgi:hypothetical protein